MMVGVYGVQQSTSSGHRVKNGIVLTNRWHLSLSAELPSRQDDQPTDLLKAVPSQQIAMLLPVLAFSSSRLSHATMTFRRIPF